LQSSAWLLPMFFAFALVAFVIVRGFAMLRSTKPSNA
jgi:hypothetical protein